MNVSQDQNAKQVSNQFWGGTCSGVTAHGDVCNRDLDDPEGPEDHLCDEHEWQHTFEIGADQSTLKEKLPDFLVRVEVQEIGKRKYCSGYYVETQYGAATILTSEVLDNIDVGEVYLMRSGFSRDLGEYNTEIVPYPDEE